MTIFTFNLEDKTIKFSSDDMLTAFEMANEHFSLIQNSGAWTVDFNENSFTWKEGNFFD